MLLDLFLNGAVLISFLAVAGALLGKKQVTPSSSFRGRAAYGIGLGLLSVVLINHSITITEDVTVDFRNIPVIIAALTGGMIPAFVAALVIAVERTAIFGLSASSVSAVALVFIVALGSSVIAKFRYRRIWMPWAAAAAYSAVITTILISFLVKEIRILMWAVPIFWLAMFSGSAISFIVVNNRSKYIRNMRRLEELSYQDPLTGLTNRRYFHKRLNAAIANAECQGTKLSVLFVDLDNFKWINDMYGHEIGDAVLIQTARRLENMIDGSATLSRLSSDEFIIMLKGAPEQQAVKIAESVLAALSQKIEAGDHLIQITPSVGISRYPEDASTADELIQFANMAMYSIKEKSKNGYSLFSDKLKESARRRSRIAQELLSAMQKDEFSLKYQPKLDVNTGAIVGVEALIRWTHSELGVVSPDEFIPVAEDSGFIRPLGNWVLETACKQHRRWRDNGSKPIRIAVNVSLKQLDHEKFVPFVKKMLEQYEIGNGELELEITERAIGTSCETVKVLERLSDLGCYISVDDFGTGYSSLSYLKSMPIDALKIDKSFVRDIFIDPVDSEIVTTIISLSNSLKLRVIAEGVETEWQLDYLRKNGCTEAQGFFIGKPVLPEEFERDFLQKEKTKAFF